MRNTMERTLPRMETKWRSLDGLSYGTFPVRLCLNRLKSTIIGFYGDNNIHMRAIAFIMYRRSIA